MSCSEKTCVPFDPGFSQFSAKFPGEVYDYLQEIAGLKQNHQKKFAFTNFESQIVPIVKSAASFYLGCILWGGYLFWKYKNDVREIEGNTLLSLPPEEQDKINYCDEIDFILGFLEKFEKSSRYYLNRSCRLNQDTIKYFEVYKQFVILNDGFKILKYTNEIKLPEEVAHFQDHSEQKLDELKQKIDETINSGNLENILTIGLYF